MDQELPSNEVSLSKFHPRFISLTHKITKETIDVVVELISAIYKTASIPGASGMEATLVMFNGGAMIPVEEDRETIKQKMMEK